MFLCIAPASFGQVLTNSGSMITVQIGAQLTVQGEVLNTTGGTVGNSGTIDLGGHWTNDSGNDCFGSSEGTVILNGVGQEIRGTSPTVFNHLQLACASATMMQDATTGGGSGTTHTGALALGNALLRLNTHLLTVWNADPNAITRTAGYLVSETDPVAGYGEVDWLIGTHAPAIYTVPFGNEATNDYLPLTMDLNTAAVGASGGMRFATYPTDPTAAPNNRPLPTGLPVLTDLGGNENAPNVVDRFWPMLAHEYLTPPNANITFTYRDSEWNTGTNTIVEPTLQAQRFNGSTWSPPSGTDLPALNQVRVNAIATYDIVWALAQSASPLPIELLYFDAQVSGDDVVCNWATATELNNDYFTVERSADGGTFTSIGEVDGAGSSQQTLSYAFTDAEPLSGVSYYRLRQTDLDGTETWTNVVSVWIDAPNGDLLVYPNPCADELFIAGAWQDDERATVLDAIGRVVAELGLVGNGRVDLSALATGTYSLQVVGASGIRSVRFVKR